MNVEDQNLVVDEAKTTRPEEEKPLTTRPRLSLISVLALLVAVLALAASIFAVRSLGALKGDVVAREEQTQIRNEIDSISRSVSELYSDTKRHEEVLAELATGQEQLIRGIDELYQERREDGAGWAIAEIEHLLIIASRKLVLERDVETALAAMREADKRLADLGAPGLIETRRQLAADINELSMVEHIDIIGLSLYLSDLVSRIENLPLNKPVSVSTDNKADAATNRDLPAWRQLLSAAWNEIRSMFVITRTGSGAEATLLPDERYFLYQNLRLQLESARLSVLRRDTQAFHASLAIVRDWLLKYFDNSDHLVVNVIDTINKMKGLELKPNLPDIGSSLAALRIYKNGTMHNRPDATDPGLP